MGRLCNDFGPILERFWDDFGMIQIAIEIVIEIEIEIVIEIVIETVIEIVIVIEMVTSTLKAPITRRVAL